MVIASLFSLGMSSLQADLSCSRSSRVMLLVRSWRRVPYSAMTRSRTKGEKAELEAHLYPPGSSTLPGVCLGYAAGEVGEDGKKLRS